MDEDSHFLPNQSGKRVDNGGDDRLSALPNEILLIILSLMPVRKAASTTILSSRWLDLWKQMLNLKSNKISQLPDRIISVILSFLPLKKAVSTSVLSSRWSDSWKHTPNLNFDYDMIPISSRTEGVGMYKYIEIVNSILQSHKALSLKQFRIRFLCFNKSHKWAVTKLLEKCLEFVFLRKVESLELDCSVHRDRVVLGESLREINTIHGNAQTLIFFQSLKTLQLAYLEVNGEDVDLLVHNCPFLERLTIRNSVLKSDIEVRGLLLKRLEIYECNGQKSIKVSAPRLAFIKFSDGAGKLLLENVPRLVAASFSRITSEFIMNHFASTTSSCISQLQFLRIETYRPKAFWSSAFPQMPNLKKLSITSIEIYNHSLLPVTRLIWASPRLEEFTLQFRGSREAPTPYMQEISNVGRSPHQHLKAFHLFFPRHEEGVRDHVVELVTYVSNNCIALRRIDIVGPVVHDDTALHLLQSQLPNHVQLSIEQWY